MAAHEFGHSLGLSHSDVRSALMAPFYRGYKPDFVLDSDDVEAIQVGYYTVGSGFWKAANAVWKTTVEIVLV